MRSRIPAKESLDALAQVVIARIIDDDIGGAMRALSWLDFIAKDESGIEREQFDKQDALLLEAWAWALLVRENVNKKKPVGFGTVVDHLRGVLYKISKLGER
jgi:hypothetical protein